MIDDNYGILFLRTNGGIYSLSGSDHSGAISIWPTASCTIVLKDGFSLGSLNAQNAYAVSPIIAQSAKFAIFTERDAYLYGNVGCPAIWLHGADSVLVIEGGGSLYAYGGDGAVAIGNRHHSSVGRSDSAEPDKGFGTLTVICRGLYAFGGDGACAIGIAPFSNIPSTEPASVLNVYAEGYVNATVTGDGSPAIGLSQSVSSAKMSINIEEGGTVEAFQNGAYAAAIGTGDSASGTCNVTISGGQVAAYVQRKESAGGAGIGTGYRSRANMKIVITGGRTQAYGGIGAAGIGGGSCANTPTIRIDGGTVVALGDTADGTSSDVKDVGAGYFPANSARCEVNGGSIGCGEIKTPKVYFVNKGGKLLSCAIITGFKPNKKIQVLVTAKNANFGAYDIYADNNGYIWLWLPQEIYTNKIFADSVRYDLDLKNCENDIGVYMKKVTIYKVTFNPNKGELDKTQTTRLVLSGKKVGTLPVPTKKGYTLKGWFSKTSGGIKMTEDTTIGRNATVYAQWTANSYTIKFNGNGNTSGTMRNMSAKYGTKYTLTANAFKRTNYTFLGWSKSADATAATYANKAEVKNLSSKAGGSVTLYAVWKRDTYTVKLYANNGGKAYVSQTMKCGASTALTANGFAKAGFKFAGWATSETGSVVYKNKEKVKDLAKSGKTKKLYGVWVPKSWAVGTFKGDGRVREIGSSGKIQKGTVTLTVESNGKISGKFVRKSDKKSFSFKADRFTDFSEGALRVTTTMQYGKKLYHVDIAVGEKAGKDNTVVGADPRIIFRVGETTYGWGFVDPND